jgi:hypothetical protein
MELNGGVPGSVGKAWHRLCWAIKEAGGDSMKKAFAGWSIIFLATALYGPVWAEDREAPQVGRFQIVTVT